MTELAMLTRTECEQIMTPYLTDLEKCFSRAGRRWKKSLRGISGAPTDVSSRSKSSLMHDLIVAEVTRAFLGRQGVRLRRQRGLLLVTFHERITLRFKKYRSTSLKTSTNATQQSLEFDSQALDLGQDLRPLTHVVAGYLMDNLNVDFRRLALTCQMNGEHLWEPINIETTTLAAIMPIVTTPVVDQGEARASRKPRVRSKRALNKDEHGNS